VLIFKGPMPHYITKLSLIYILSKMITARNSMFLLNLSLFLGSTPITVK